MGVALITPFKSDGSVDYNALVRLVEYQVQNGGFSLCTGYHCGNTDTD